MIMIITVAQLRITYTYIAAFIALYHIPPTIFEISRLLGLRYDIVRHQLIEMERQGWIAPREGLRLGIELRGMKG